MNNLDFYLTCDHSARKRVTYYSIVTGIAVGAAAQLLGASFELAAVLCVAATGFVEVLGAIVNARPRTKPRPVAFNIRRELIFAGFSLAILLSLSLSRIPQSETAALEQKLQLLATNPSSPENARAASQVLAGASAAGIEISPATLESVGKQFTLAATDQTGAWNAALACVSYRSFLNAISTPEPVITGRPMHWVMYLDQLVTEHEGTMKVGVWGGELPLDRAAAIELIGKPLNANEKFGPAHVGLGSATGPLKLDGYRLQNVTFSDDKIIYRGGPLELHNVSFINCTFEFELTPSSRALAEAILSSNPTTLQHEITATHGAL